MGQKCKVLCLPHSYSILCHQAWKGHCLSPPLTETNLQVSNPKPSQSVPPFLPPLVSMGTSSSKAFILLMCAHSYKWDQANSQPQACKQQALPPGMATSETPCYIKCLFIHEYRWRKLCSKPLVIGEELHLRVTEN